MKDYINMFKDNDIIIAPSHIKKELLSIISSNFLKVKLFTMNEFKNEFFYSYSKESIYYLVKNYNLSYDVAIEYLDNINFDIPSLKDIKEVLLSNNLLSINSMLSNNRIIIINYNHIEPYISKFLSNNEVLTINPTKSKYNPKVYEFTTSEDEITYIANSIISLLNNNISINDIKLVNVNDDYKRDIKRIFKFFNIPVELDKSKSIIGTNAVSEFLKNINEFKDIRKSLDSIEDSDIKDKIIDIINSYAFVDSVDDSLINILKYELKRATISTISLENKVELVTINELEDNKYYFLLGCNQGSIPTNYHDDELIKDKYRSNLGLYTSLDKLINEKEDLKEILTTTKNLTISYKNKDFYSTYYPSPIIKDLNLEVIKNPQVTFNYSNIYNKLELSKYLDSYMNYNEQNDNLIPLLNTYKDIPYNTYNNKYQNVDFSDLNDYLKGKTNLSYSSMNNYFNCAFRFYIENMLHLNPYEDTFATFLGNLFHDCLSKMYNADFNLKTSYEEYLTKRDLTNKERFFVNKLYPVLEEIIHTIKYQEKYTKFDKVLTEQHISIDKSNKLTINFLGFIDKIKYMELDNKLLIAIIDYKTGFVETTLDNINYGLHLQLPVYIYLAKNGFQKDIQITGFYLQKILNNPEIDTDNASDDFKKKLRLEGYTIDNEEYISLFDSSYDKSEVIKGMSLTSKGFSSYTKLINNDEIDKIVSIVDDKISEVISSIENTNFNINPKRINDKLIGCNFCKYKEMCFRKEEDIVNLEETKIDDILGRSKDNAKVD